MPQEEQERDRHVICHNCTLIVPQLEAYKYPEANKHRKHANSYFAYLCPDCSDSLLERTPEIC